MLPCGQHTISDDRPVVLAERTAFRTTTHRMHFNLSQTYASKSSLGTVVNNIRELSGVSLNDVETERLGSDAPNAIRERIVQFFQINEMIKRHRHDWQEWTFCCSLSIPTDEVLVVGVNGVEARVLPHVLGEPEELGRAVTDAVVVVVQTPMVVIEMPLHGARAVLPFARVDQTEWMANSLLVCLSSRANPTGYFPGLPVCELGVVVATVEAIDEMLAVRSELIWKRLGQAFLRSNDADFIVFRFEVGDLPRKIVVRNSIYL
ncbi:MAG: hypothetical protein B7Z55_07085 [Planctomycetales bacterium 12-60-4]|nr:MAG: hypothetical protein B7Z55_07085 [Planctomycetales bacterium 12-60-4]